ncbi:ChbG/HpnK family deacetylase [Terrarubrum flagellatum]|uniref:ChbG/HpnK family deacetylase n=1 Tax=Terrirubrum flagellatum TaxID=2895980 RepID=UPI003144F125
MADAASTDDERGFALCADDYALTPAVSEGILGLLALGRLSATGAMTNRPHWRAGAPALKPFAKAADIGVHLNLTCGAPLGAMPDVAPEGKLPLLPRLARLALLSASARAEIAAEIGRQLDAFEAEFGGPPDFVDGHQHAHALPGIGANLIAILARRYGGRSGFFVRDPADRLSAILARPAAAKALSVAVIAAGFGARARRAGLATNRGFSGFSAFDPEADYGAEFAGALKRPGPAHLVMCHPGEIDEELRAADPVIATRPRELAFLASGRFDEVCAEAGLGLRRLSGRGRSGDRNSASKG